MHTLESLTKAGFEVEVKNGETWDMTQRWFVTAKMRAVERHDNGRKKRGVGTNVFIGAGDTTDDAIANLIANVNEMALDLNLGMPGGHTIEPNTDAKAAKEQPLKIVATRDVDVAEDGTRTIIEPKSVPPLVAANDGVRRVAHLLRTHGNSATSLSTLIHAGVVTAAEVREATGLSPIAKERPMEKLILGLEADVSAYEEQLEEMLEKTKAFVAERDSLLAA